MRIILTLLRKDFARLFRDKAGLSLTFIVPFALICLFGQIFGVNRQDAGPSGIPLGIVIESRSARRHAPPSACCSPRSRPARRRPGD